MTNLAKNIFVVAVAVATIATFGLGFAMPSFAIETGDLVKGPNSDAVYYIDGTTKYVFPDAKTYFSWYSDFSNVQLVTVTELDNYADGGMVLYRSGTKMVTHPNTNKVYAVEPSGNLRWIPSEEIAAGLFGADWASRVNDINEVFFPNYTVGSDLASATDVPNGSLVMMEGETTIYLIDGSSKRPFASMDDLTSNGYDADYVLTVSDLSAFSDGASISGAESSLMDVAQGGTIASDPIVISGDLTVSLASSSPAAANVPINVDNVVFARINFAASEDGSVQVNTIGIHRSGLGSDSDFSSITLYSDGEKLANARTSFNSDHKAVFNLTSGFVIPANTTKTVEIRAKLGTASTYNKLGIASAGDVIVSSGSVAGSYPVYGSTMTGVTLADLGAVTVVGESTSNQTKKIGETDVQLAYFSLEETSGKEDLSFHSITLKNVGTAKDSSFGNFVLKNGSTVLATDATMVNDYITFNLSEPFAVDKSNKEYFRVYGDVMDGDTTTAEFLLKYDTDLNVTGSVYGYNVTITRTSFNDAGESITTTVDGAELNISLDSTTKNTPDETTNYEFAKFNLSSGQDVKITGMTFSIDETDASGGTAVVEIDDVELVDANDGTVYSLTQSAGADGTAVDAVWYFDSEEVMVNAGETTTLIVRGDIPSGVADGDQYNVKMTVNTTNLVAETVDGGDAIDNFSVSSLTGKLITVKASNLTIKASAMNSADAVPSETDVVVFGGTLEAGTASDVTVEALQFEGADETATNLDVDNLNRAVLVVNPGTASEYEGQVISSGLTDDTLDFNELSIVIPAGGSVGFEVRVDLLDTFTANTTLAIDLETVSAKDDDNDTVAAADEAGTAIAAGAELVNTRDITLRASGALALSIDATASGFNKDRVVLAGESTWVGKIKAQVYYEPVILKDLTLTNATADDEDSLDSVCLYSAMEAVEANLIDCTTMSTADLMLFKDFSYTLPVGSNYLYVYATSRPIDNSAVGTADTHDVFTFSIDDDLGDDLDVHAAGASSGVTLDDGDNDSTIEVGEIVFDADNNGTFDEAGDTATGATKSYEVAANMISSVSFVNSYGGQTVSSGISGTGTYTLAIMQVSVADSDSTSTIGTPLKLELDNLLFDVSKWGTTMALSGMTVERIGGIDGAQALASADGALAAGDALGTATDAFSTGATTDGFIDAGDTAYFVVKGTVSALDGTSNVINWVQVDLTYLDSGDTTNAIDWKDGSSSTNFDYLRLDTTSISGTKISAPINN